MGKNKEAEDIDRGWAWYRQHELHVESIIKGGSTEFPPSGSDISRPELWKPESWRWFFRNHHRNAHKT